MRKPDVQAHSGWMWTDARRNGLPLFHVRYNINRDPGDEDDIDAGQRPYGPPVATQEEADARAAYRESFRV